MFQDSLTKKIAEAAAKIKTEYHEVEVNVNSVEGAVSKIMNEKLIGNQHKIDANKNNKIDAHDFKLLRKKKKVEEEAEQIDELKKSTLGSYVKKASKDLAGQSFEHGEDEHRQYGDPEDTERENEMKKRERDIENRQKGISRAATKLSKEETELTESHFKVGDKVRCKESGMDGEITKLDKEDGGEDEKYYTFKREDGKVMKKAPNELSKINEEFHNKKKDDTPSTSNSTKKPVRNSDGTIQSPISRARALAQQGLKRAMSKEEVEKIDELSFEEFNGLSEENKNLYMEMLDSVETQLREIGLLDEEQLDEISTTAAKNYLHKALPSSSKLNQKAAKPGEEAAKKFNYSYDNAPYETKEFKKFSKRRTGIRKAIDKLASAHPENKKHATAARRAFDSIHNANYRVGMGEPNDNDRANIRDAHKTVKAAVNAMHKNAMKEGVGLDEAMFPGTKEYEKKFGQSPQQKLKKKGDTVPTSQGDMTKTDKGIAHRRRFTEMLESYTEGGLKYIATLVQEEPDNEEFTKEVEEVKRKATQKKSPEDEARVAKASVQAVKVEEVEELDEAMTRKHFQQVADVIKSHPDQEKRNELAKHHAGIFKASNPRFDHNRFYQAAGANIKEEVEQIDELSKSTLASYAKKASHEARMKHGIGKDFERIKNSSRKLEYKQGAKEWEDKYKSDARRREAGVGKAIDRLAKEETEIQVINADIANGVQFDNIEERSLTEPEMKKKEEIVKSMKKGMEGFKARYGDRAKQVAYATATKIAKEKA